MPVRAGRRVAAGLIDGVVFAALIVAGTVLLADMRDPMETVALVTGLAGALVHLLPEVLFGRTVGKLLTGTKVVDCAGNKPTTRQILDRYLFGSRIFINAHSLLRTGRARHDRLSRTFVVSTTQPWRAE